ncbi:MAG TPA: putative PEP-binding protein [Streptosporangiaceae bacterium]
MSPGATYPGRMVSPGVATGQVYLGEAVTVGAGAVPAGPGTPDEVRAAFAAVAAERFALAERLRTEGRDDQAAIVEIGGLMAGDPTLVEAAVAAVTSGTGAVAAVSGAATAQADILAALPNEDLAARADDVRQVGQAVVAQLTSAATVPPPAGDFILIQREVDPADLIRLADEGLTGAVSVTGGASSHAAIIARGLGLPMLAGVDPAVLDLPAGRPVLIDAPDPTQARLILDPDPADPAAPAGPAPEAPIPAAPPTTQAPPSSPAPRVTSASSDTSAPPVHRTADGQEVTLLVNAASAREVRMGLAAGAAGVGLLRTEIPFVGARAWPTQAEHEAALRPVLSLLAGRPAVVRLLDFSGDKVPPFLAGSSGPKPANGLTSLLAAPDALGDQLRAILATGRDTDLRIMVPMVTAVRELTDVAALLAGVAAQDDIEGLVLGMMVEVASTAAGVSAFTSTAGFFSVGTNDLTSEVLGIDRADPRMSPALAADPRVLALLARVTTAAAAARVPVSVCGDAAADPAVLPLLLGLGIRTFSVGAARVPQVAAWVAGADSARCADETAAVLAAAPSAPVSSP